jgi:phosphate transport system permease protein
MKTNQDNLVHFVLALLTALVLGVFIFFVGSIIYSGAHDFELSFLYEVPLKAGRSGGIYSIILSTAMILLVCLAATVPIGLGAGYYLSEFSNEHKKIGSFVRWSLNVLASAPSIIFGLFGNIFFSVYLKLGFSILSGGLTLACMCLPFFIYAVENGFKSVPLSVKKSATALQLSQTTILFKILLPSAQPYIVTGFLISIARAFSETAALIFTSGSVDRMPESFFDSGRTLSVHIYELSMNVTGGDQNAFRTAFVLLLLVLATNLTAKMLFKPLATKAAL